MAASQRTLEPLSAEHLNADLKDRSIRRSVASGSHCAQFLIQFVATVVPARLLMPADFGLVAMSPAVTLYMLIPSGLVGQF